MTEKENGRQVLLITSQHMGRGDDELGAILIRSFIHVLGEIESAPDAVILYNSGVKLAVEGSPLVDELRALAESGVFILACGTCLGHFGLKEKLAVGEVSNMYSIAEIVMSAGRVVRL